MAGWRHAVELAMADEAIEKLTAISRSRNQAAAQRPGVNAAQVRQQPVVLRGGTKTPGRSSDGTALRRTSAGLGPLAALHDHRDRARSRRSRRKRRPGWCRWRATRPKSTVIRTSCGRPGFWPAMRASAGRRRGTNVSAICPWHGGQDPWPKDIKPHKVRYYLERRDAEFEQKWRRFCASIARSRSEKTAAKPNKLEKPVVIVSYDEKPEIEAIATTAPDSPPRQASMPPSRG